jgi:hypothetical protein
MVSSKDISVDYGDRTYRGSYRMAGQLLHVDGACGNTSAMLNGLQGSPELLAQMLLYGLAQSWNRDHSRRGAQALSA